MTDKARCDGCGKEVGSATLWRRMGFLPGSAVNQVCTSCYNHRLRRDDRMRFAKGPLRRKAAPAAEDTEDSRPAEGPPDELRFGG